MDKDLVKEFPELFDAVRCWLSSDTVSSDWYDIDVKARAIDFADALVHSSRIADGSKLSKIVSLFKEASVQRESRMLRFVLEASDIPWDENELQQFLGHVARHLEQLEDSR